MPTSEPNFGSCILLANSTPFPVTPEPFKTEECQSEKTLKIRMIAVSVRSSHPTFGGFAELRPAVGFCWREGGSATCRSA
jgi:hypothetical protein